MLAYTLKNLFKFRSELRGITKNKQHCYSTVLSINPEALKSEGIRILALDFDGVLNIHNASHVTPSVLAWMKQCCDVFEEKNLYLHSNNNLDKRLRFLKRHFPDMQILNPNKKKPYPDGLQSITQQTQIPPDQIALVDDRLLTGMLAATQAGCYGVYITQPFCDFEHSPFYETAFWLLRKLEYFLLW
ncbi:MAG: HAD family hydrolase [Coxiellaceae bacterium]|nr:HAD family hydrolase [Coxiellaceae bacterium]